MKERLLKIVGVLCLAVAVGMLAMTGCGAEGASSGGGKTKVVLNEVAHSIFYAPMYVAIEEGYFVEEGIELELVTGFGADKTMTAVLTGEADIGFMGSESTVYTYAGGTEDYVVNFAQLTQRAGNFLVSRKPVEDFSWDMLIDRMCWEEGQAECRKWFSSIFWRRTESTRKRMLGLTRALISVPPLRPFPVEMRIIPWNLSLMPPCWSRKERGMW